MIAIWRRAGVAALMLATALPVQADEQRLLIAPHATDERLAASDAPHLVVYEPGAPMAPLLVWLPGTHGHPATGPKGFFETVRQQGYRLLALSYPTAIGVSQVCTVQRVRTLPRCAEAFRQQRVWGDQPTSLIEDRAEDAIVPRLIALLQHLAAHDPAGQWAQYLDGDQPRWDRLVLAGQSQGGGMAAFLAQSRRVAGVLMFSGGWDHGANGQIASWYARASQTPPERWHATFHVEEPNAPTMAKIARTLGLPADHIHGLDQPVVGRNPHTEGIANPAYQPLWREALPRQP